MENSTKETTCMEVHVDDDLGDCEGLIIKSCENAKLRSIRNRGDIIGSVYPNITEDDEEWVYNGTRKRMRREALKTCGGMVVDYIQGRRAGG